MAGELLDSALQIETKSLGGRQPCLGCSQLSSHISLSKRNRPLEVVSFAQSCSVFKRMGTLPGWLPHSRPLSMLSTCPQSCLILFLPFADACLRASNCHHGIPVLGIHFTQHSWLLASLCCHQPHAIPRRRVSLASLLPWHSGLSLMAPLKSQKYFPMLADCQKCFTRPCWLVIFSTSSKVMKWIPLGFLPLSPISFSTNSLLVT